MRTLLPLGIFLSLAGPVACGPTPEPVAPKPAQPDVKPAPAAVAGAAPLDLSPVPEPASLVGIMRWSNPSATLSNLTGCAGLPPQLAEGNIRIAVEELLGEALGKSIDKKQLGAVVALDAPVHVVVALDTSSRRSNPIAAFSVGLSSLERAKGAVEGTAPLTEMMPGMWKIGGKERSSSSCAIAASAGSTPARLLCGDRDKDLAALGPYLARTLPAAAPDGRDLHGEVRFVPLSDKFGGLARQQLRGLPILAQSELSIGEPKFDKALVEAANGIQDELTALIGDADKLTFDVGVDPRTCLTATGAVELRGKTSWLAGAISDGADRAGAPPALFWRLPKESEVAFFARGADPARYATPLKTLRALLDGWLTKENIGKPADRKALVDLIDMPLKKETTSVSASGHVDATPVKGDKASPQQMLDGMLGSWIGWTLVGVDEGPDTMTKYLKDLVAVYNRPGLIGPLKKELRDDAKLLPTVKTVPAPKELGKSSLDIEIKFKDIPAPNDGFAPAAAGKAAPRPKTLTFTMHVLLMGEDKVTWVAFGTDRADLVKHLSAVKTGAPDAGTLATRPGIEQLKGGKMMSGGFLTMAPLTRAFSSGVSYFSQALGGGGAPPEVREIMNILNNLPHKAESPIFLTSQARGGNAPRGEISFNLTKPALEDLGALVLGGLKVAGMLNP
jgi:hypothetical protein